MSSDRDPNLVGEPRAAAAIVPIVAGAAWGLTAAAAAAARGGELETEGLFLAGLGALVLALLAAAATRARGLALALVWAAAAVTSWLAVIALGPPLRGAATVSPLALAAVTVWASALVPRRPDPTRLDLARLVPAAVALQLLFRGSESLTRPSILLEAWTLIVLPLLGIGALTLLAKRAGSSSALLAATVSLAIAGGWSLAVVAALAAPALLPSIVDSRPRGADRALAAVALVGLCLGAPAPGAIAVLAAAATLWRRLWPALLLVTAGALAWLLPTRGWPEVAAGLALLFLVVPSAAELLRPRHARSAGLPDRGPWIWPLVAAGSLAVVATRSLPLETALLAPAVLLALGLGSSRPRRLRPFLLYAAILLGFSLLASSYPWLRASAPTAAIDLLPGGPATWLALAASISVLFAVRSAAPGWRAVERWAPALALALVALPPVLASTPARVLLDWPPRTLTATAPVWEMEREAWPGGRLVIDSALANSTSIAIGAPVATIRLVSAGGRQLAQRRLRNGLDTGEWAAARLHLAAPAPYLTAVAGDGTLAARYRAASSSTIAVNEPVELRIELAPNLPPEASLTVFGVRLVGRAGEETP